MFVVFATSLYILKLKETQGRGVPDEFTSVSCTRCRNYSGLYDLYLSFLSHYLANCDVKDT